MTYQVLSLKWRPTEFNQVIGQSHITQALSNAIKLNRLAHAFTFSGPRGVGKTTTARILAKKINDLTNLSDSLDVIEMDAASNRGIDEIRNLKENINFAPAHGKYKIYIIDEVHMLTKEAFNALLKTLEEPPEYVKFILATTELHKMPETIISRTQRYEFKRLNIGDIMNQMSDILKHEKINFDKESLKIIAQKADGSMRDALSILDQMICYCDNDMTCEKIEKALGVVSNDLYLTMLQCVGKREIESILNILQNILNNGVSVNNLVSGFSDFLRDCLLYISSSKSNKNFNKIEGLISKKDIPFKELDLLRILDICLKFQINMKNYKNQEIALEVLMIKLAYLDKTIDINEFLINKQNNEIKLKDTLQNQTEKKIEKKNEEIIIIKENVIQKDEKTSKNSKTISDKVNKIINIVDKSGDEKKENIINNQKDIKEVLVDIKTIENRWDKIKEIINERNSKTAMFLENIKFKKMENEKLFIEVNDMNNFSIKALEKDKDIIQDAICVILKQKIQLILSYNILEPKGDKKKESLKIENDEDHPLFMEALGKFKGKLIK